MSSSSQTRAPLPRARNGGTGSYEATRITELDEFGIRSFPSANSLALFFSFGTSRAIGIGSGTGSPSGTSGGVSTGTSFLIGGGASGVAGAGATTFAGSTVPSALRRGPGRDPATTAGGDGRGAISGSAMQNASPAGRSPRGAYI